MANPWFRMYAEFATDPKVQMLSEVDQRRYLMLLCLRCSDGDVTLHETEVAFQLRISNEEWAATRAVLVAKNLITDDGKPTSWDKRQYASDSSAARTFAYRERKKRHSDVTVTKCDALDTDTDTDTEESKALSAASATAAGTDKNLPVPAKPKTKRKTAMPEQFLLSPDMAKWARERAPAASLNLETEKFVNHYRGKGETRADWVASWRTWMLNAQTYATNRSKNHPAPTDPNDTAWAENMGDML